MAGVLPQLIDDSARPLKENGWLILGIHCWCFRRLFNWKSYNELDTFSRNPTLFYFPPVRMDDAPNKAHAEPGARGAAGMMCEEIFEDSLFDIYEHARTVVTVRDFRYIAFIKRIILQADDNFELIDVARHILGVLNELI